MGHLAKGGGKEHSFRPHLSISELLAHATLQRVFSVFMWNLFPIIQFCAVDGTLPITITQPLWALMDW